MRANRRRIKELWATDSASREDWLDKASQIKRVSAAEIEASLQKAMERRRDRILADLDTNKDGAISRAELDASVDRLIAAADADRDGGVTLDEAKSYRLAKLRKPATPTGEQAN